MKNCLFIIVILGLSIVSSCKRNPNHQMNNDEVWKLCWRMIESSMDENFEIADLQFDSLLKFSDKMDLKFLVTGLEVKSELGKTDEIVKILNGQSQDVLNQICQKQFVSDLEPCSNVSKEQVENKSLQKEILKMFVDDQAARGNLMSDIISKYNLDTTQITNDNGISIDARNRNRLKEIFSEFGFPNRRLIGKDAMNGIFLIIQHSDGDKEWQKSQLKNIETAVKNGDMDGQSYAYLYDRIKINSGEKQFYGTQFSNVDPINKIVELADTEDVENLDSRRREIGMMPIGMYKKFMMRSF